MIPTKVVYLTEKDKPWVSPFLKSLIHARWNANRKKDWSLYEKLKVKVKNLLQRAKRRWTEDCASSARGIWKAVNYLNGKSNRPFDINNKSNVEVINDRFKCVFGSQFTRLS